MDVAAVLALIAKGISVAEAIVQVGGEAVPAFQAIKALITGAQQGTLTDDQLTQTEALLDQMIADFNLDLPPAA